MKKEGMHKKISCFSLILVLMLTLMNTSNSFSVGASTTMDDFESYTVGSFPSGWLNEGGTWEVVDDNGSQCVREINGGSTYFLYKDLVQTDQTIVVDVKPSSTITDAGIVGRYNDSNNYYTLFLDDGQIKLKKKVGGIWTTLDTASFSYNTSAYYTLKLEILGTEIKGYIDNTMLVNNTDTSLSSGRPGLRVYQNKAFFDNFTVDFPQDGSSDTKITATSVTASSHDGNVPTNTIDGSLSTRWSADGDGQWIQYDLGSQKNVDYLMVAWYKGDLRMSTFDIQVSADGSTWTNVYNGSSSGGTLELEKYEFTDKEGRYVRIVGHGNTSNTWNSITETEIYGSDGTNPNPNPDATYVSSTTELNNALDSVSSGDTLVLNDGSYSGIVKTVSVDNVTIKAENSGKAFITGTSTITVTGDGCLIDGLYFKEGQPSSDRGALDIKGNNNRVTNVSIVSYNGTGKKWLSLEGTYHEVDHCYFKGKNTEGALLTVWREDSSPNYHHIHDNVFRDYASGGGSNGWETMRIGDSSQSDSKSYVTIENNYFYGCNGEIEMISVKSGAVTVRGNTVISSEGQITFRHGIDGLAENNVIITNNVSGGGGIRLYDEGHTVKNNYIEGVRTTSNIRGGIVIMSGDTTASTPRDHGASYPLNGYWTAYNCTIQNNTVVNSQQSMLYNGKHSVAPWNITFKNNVLRNDINGNGQFDLIREDKAIVNPSYINEMYYGSSVGLSPIPSGISTTSITLTQNSDDLWLHSSNGAQGLTVLSESDVGPNYIP